MFEDYLEDAAYFAERAQEITDKREAKRYYRASVFYAISAMEAFINYLADVQESFKPYEIAFLTDRKFRPSKGRFGILDSPEYHSIEDKLRFLIERFIHTFDFNIDPSWSRCLDLKKLRDKITHPHHEEDEIDPSVYQQKLKDGLNSIIKIMDNLFYSVFKKHLRQRLLDLAS